MKKCAICGAVANTYYSQRSQLRTCIGCYLNYKCDSCGKHNKDATGWYISQGEKICPACKKEG